MTTFVECPIKMGTYDEDDQMVICMSEEHSHCGGCYAAFLEKRVYCSSECQKMVADYEADESAHSL